MMHALEAQVLQFVAESTFKVNFACLQRHFQKTNRTTTRELKSLVAGLVRAQRLCYTFHYGSSFLEISYDRPQAVSEHVVVKPPRSTAATQPDQVVVTLGRGAAFGGGDHPTTRLALQLIDTALHQQPWNNRKPTLRAIDIGTGSGILAIAAAQIGIGSVCGIDTDPCAVFEARENVRLNHLESRVVVLSGELKKVDGVYDFVFANLRAPTLSGMRDLLQKKIRPESVLVFSGFKTDESMQISEFYNEVGFIPLQERSEKGWCALCLARGDSSAAGELPII